MKYVLLIAWGLMTSWAFAENHYIPDENHMPPDEIEKQEERLEQRSQEEQEKVKERPGHVNDPRFDKFDDEMLKDEAGSY